MKKIKLGDFTKLAKNYNKNRPDYSSKLLIKILNKMKINKKKIFAIDAGAGTGIFTRMLAKKLCNIYAVEPNKEMYKIGKYQSTKKIKWINAKAEKIPLESNKFHFLSMASSFHWVNFSKGLKEFNRLLTPGGIFLAIWNPRLIKGNKLLEQIENYLYSLNPKMKRISSGNSDFTKNLKKNLLKSNYFSKVIYMEEKHKINFTKKRYIDAWRSVNDIRSKLGEDKFNLFLKYIQKKIINKRNINALYLNKAWVCFKKN
jgi:ubiquinone/menaquinone biosynthesis C-methylase UbiE